MSESETLTIKALTYGPDAIAHRTDGKAVFIPEGAPGDVVTVEYTEEKSHFARARIVEILERGFARVQVSNDLALLSSAAPWSHVAYSEQLEAKRTNVVESLIRIAKMHATQADSVVAPCIASPEQEHYRNKIELTCTTDTNNRIYLGITNEQGNVQPIERYALAQNTIEDAPKKIQGALRYMEGGQPGRLGIHRVGIRSSKHTGACEIALWTAPGPFPRKEVAHTLRNALHTTSIVRVLSDPGRARKVKGVEALSGEGCWRERVAGYDFRVSAPSFFQVNTMQANTLVSTVLSGLHVRENARIADLYCGVGTFTLPLAGYGCDVSAVESAGAAVRDLRRNAENAGLPIHSIGGDSARELPDLGSLDALVVDPPRAGLADGVAESIAQAGPLRVAYVSCDSATWARDVLRMNKCGYSLEEVVPVDLFPHTYHCELVSFFAKQ